MLFSEFMKGVLVARVIIYSYIIRLKAKVITQKLGTTFAVLCNKTVNNIVCAFLFPRAQGFEKQASMIALSAVVFFFFLPSRELNKCRTRDNFVPPSSNAAHPGSRKVFLTWLLLVFTSLQECSLQVLNFHLVQILILEIGGLSEM